MTELEEKTEANRELTKKLAEKDDERLKNENEMRQIKLTEIKMEKSKDDNWKQGEDKKVKDEWAKMQHKQKILDT